MNSSNDKNAKDEMLSRLAREDYLRMGPQRSIKGLFESYKVKSRTEGRASVPTLNYPTLSRWRKENDWDAWVAQRLEEEQELDNAAFRTKRERALNQLTLLTDDVMAEMGRMIKDPMTPASVKAKLFETVLSRVIIDSKKDDDVGNNKLRGLPDPDATLEEKKRWLSDLQA